MWRRICRTTTISIAAAAPVPLAAQLVDVPAVTFPNLPDRAADEAAMTPKGWKIAKRATGDLNGDGRADLALLVRMNDRRNVVAIEDTKPVEPFDTNPYLLAIAFADDAGYRLAASTHEFFVRPEIPYSGDLLPEESDSVEIERGTLLLHNEYLRGWDSYRFRWNGRDFALIGFDSGGASGACVERISINYLIGKVVWSNEPIGEGKSATVTRAVKKSTDLPTLATFDNSEFIPSDTIDGGAPPCEP